MKKKIILVLFLAIQVPCIVGASVSDEQVTLLAKQKREFVRGIRGIRHIFSKDTITPEERAALKSLVKKGAVLTAALAGIAVAGYIGKKYLGKVSLSMQDVSAPVTLSTVTLCDELFEINVPKEINQEWREENDTGGCYSLVKIKKINPEEYPKLKEVPLFISGREYFLVDIEAYVEDGSDDPTPKIREEIEVAMEKSPVQVGILYALYFQGKYQKGSGGILHVGGVVSYVVK